MATMTHWTTCLRPFARLIARSGLKTRKIRRILKTDSSELKYKYKIKIHGKICANVSQKDGNVKKFELKRFTF